MLACPVCRKLYPSDASDCSVDGSPLLPVELLPEEDAKIEPGSMVGEYRIERKLGSGTFGAVYAAEQPIIGKRVAIKVLHRKFASDAGVVSRFVSEARAVNRIRHKNIIDIFSFGVLNDGVPYFVMELLEGMTVRELLDHEKRLPVAEALPILRGIADGLDAAHEAGVTHRDLKPDNIFLVAEKDGGHFPKLLDFGVAKLVADGVAHKTATGAAVGTPSYMAPEQCRAQAVDHRADIYALGVVIHELLTGQRLFHADSAMDVLIKHVSEPPRAMSEVSPDLPRELDAPVLAMLAKKPKDRPRSAGAAVAAIAARAKEGSARAAERAAGEQGSFERALARREAITVNRRGGGREGSDPQNLGPADVVARPRTNATGVAVASTPSEETPALQVSTLTSEPARALAEDRASDPEVAAPAPEASATAAPKVPAATSDGRFAISSKGNTIKVWDLRTGQAVHTFQGQGQAGPAEEPVARDPGSSSSGAPAVRGGRAARAQWLALAGVGAAILAVVVVWQRQGPPPLPPIATAEPGAAAGSVDRPPSWVTLRLSVTPADADVMLDGLHAGKASEPIVLPRSERRSAIRLEKHGFEAQTLWIVPDRDADLPAIVLRAAAPEIAPPPGSSGAEPPRRGVPGLPR